MAAHGLVDPGVAALAVGAHHDQVARILVDRQLLLHRSGGEPLLYMESAFKTIAPAEVGAVAAAMR